MRLGLAAGSLEEGLEVDDGQVAEVIDGVADYLRHIGAVGGAI